MPKIGILYGMETTFPSALVERINSKNIAGLAADHLKLDGVKVGGPSRYDVIVDRISHDVDFYSAFLKSAVLHGAWVINNPFRWAADDKFLHYSIAAKNGISVPNTVLIPQKLHPPGTTSQSMRNLAFPLNWEAIFEHVKFPAYLKPLRGGRWMSVQRIESPEQFFAAYDQTGSACMLLQSAVAFDVFYRVYVVGTQARVVRYDRQQTQHRRRVSGDGGDAELHDRLKINALKLCQALGYDINAVDFAAKNEHSYIIDSFNLAPNADLHTVGPKNFEWLVDNIAQLAIDRALGNADSATQLRPERRFAAASAGLP
ncbi:MAG TPA: hypothetical protein VH351_14115 [Bryobacteraceae bacterium]|jgi:glutathione synthase/RimK-type ligase-like ATP-grasp enzyme|nr:hypothetical protein [Bryobacteraceae bacterium]